MIGVAHSWCRSDQKPTDFPRRNSLRLCTPLKASRDSNHRIDVYFQYVHPSFPILHKPTFLTSLLLPPSLRPQTTIILRAVVASAAAYANVDSRLSLYTETLPVLYSNHAYHQRIIDYALDSPTLSSLQAL